MDVELGKKCGFGACEESASAVVEHCGDQRWVCGDHLYWLTARTSAKEIRCCEHGRWPTCWECSNRAQPAISDNIVGNRCMACNTDDGHVTGCRWLRSMRPASPPEVDPVPVPSRWRYNGDGSLRGQAFTVKTPGDPMAVIWDDGLTGTWRRAEMLKSCTRLPDAPAPEAKPEYCAVCDRGLECREHAPEAKPAVCGDAGCAFDWGHNGACSNHSSAQPTTPPAPAPYACAPGCTKEQRCMVGPEDDPRRCPGWTEPRPYRCAKDCTPAKPCWGGDKWAWTRGEKACPAHLEQKAWMGTRHDGISPNLHPARSYPAGELSWSHRGSMVGVWRGRR